MSADIENLDNRFSYHPPKKDQTSRYMLTREQARQFAYDLVGRCPDSRELSIALTKLDEVVMWANAAIARNE